ncbi:MAG: hypothetical protein NT080_14740 [Spirochaetes bacterium]|nr:hypothetical protein [Spirochaetota bacterium]
METVFNDIALGLALVPPGNIAKEIAELRTSLFRRTLDTSFRRFPELIVLTWLPGTDSADNYPFPAGRFPSVSLGDFIHRDGFLFLGASPLPPSGPAEGPFPPGYGFLLGETPDGFGGAAGFAAMSGISGKTVRSWTLAVLRLELRDRGRTSRWSIHPLRRLKARQAVL